MEDQRPQIGAFRAYIRKLMELFDDISFHHIPREENQMADALATLSSMFKVSPHGDLPYIEFRCRVEPAHYCLIEEEKDVKPWYFDIKRYIKDKEYPPEAFDNDKRTLQRLAASFLLNGDVLLFDKNTCLLPLPNWYYLFLYGSGLTGKCTGSPSKNN